MLEAIALIFIAFAVFAGGVNLLANFIIEPLAKFTGTNSDSWFSFLGALAVCVLFVMITSG